MAAIAHRARYDNLAAHGGAIDVDHIQVNQAAVHEYGITDAHVVGKAGVVDVNAADAVLISSVEVLSADAVEVLSGVATALFLLNWAALAVTLFGLSRTVLELRLAPRWTDRVSIAGSGLLLVGSMQSAAALDGVLPGLLLGFAGFAIWILFLLVTGIRLVRTDRTELTVTKAAA